MTQLTLIRHGETDWNKSGRMQGFLDSSLTETGIQQAEATARALSVYSFEAIYSSPLGRARRTAEIIASSHTQPIEFIADLRERNLGIMQGLTLSEFRDRHPEFHEDFMADPDFVIPEGESSRQRFERGNSCLKGIAERHPDGSVLVVTHGGIIDGVFRRIFDIPLTEPRHYSLYNCAVSRIGINGGTWRLFTWGDIHHLRETGALDDE